MQSYWRARERTKHGPMLLSNLALINVPSSCRPSERRHPIFSTTVFFCAFSEIKKSSTSWHFFSPRAWLMKDRVCPTVWPDSVGKTLQFCDFQWKERRLRSRSVAFPASLVNVAGEKA